MSDPGVPTWVADAPSVDGDGGYVHRQGHRVYLGDRERGTFYDFTGGILTEIGRVDVQGDLDTISPIGNVALVSVDDQGEPGQAATVFPVYTEPDAAPPVAERHCPADGAAEQALTSRMGVSFDEWIEWASVHNGSFRVVGPEGEVDGRFHVQEGIVNFSPTEPLMPDSTYEVWLPAGGGGRPLRQPHGPGAALRLHDDLRTCRGGRVMAMARGWSLLAVVASGRGGPEKGPVVEPPTPQETGETGGGDAGNAGPLEADAGEDRFVVPGVPFVLDAGPMGPGVAAAWTLSDGEILDRASAEATLMDAGHQSVVLEFCQSEMRSTSRVSVTTVYEPLSVPINQSRPCKYRIKCYTSRFKISMRR